MPPQRIVHQASIMQTVRDQLTAVETGSHVTGSVGGTEGRKFLDYHEIPLAPAINARDEIGLGRRRRAVDEIDLDEKCGVCRLRQRELACSRSAERLMRDEPIGLPAVQNGFAGQIREGEPGLPVHAKEFESTSALRRKLLKG